MYTMHYDLEVQNWDGLSMVSKLGAYEQYLESVEPLTKAIPPNTDQSNSVSLNAVHARPILTC